MAQLIGGGPKGGPSGVTSDVNSMLSGLGMSGLVGQDQAGMQQAGLAAGLGSIGQGLMQGGAQGGLFDSSGLPSAADSMQAAMLRYGMDPNRQARSAAAVAQTPQSLQAPGLGAGGMSSWAMPEYDFAPQMMPGGGGMGGQGARPSPSNILDILRMMGSGGGF